MLRPTRFEPWNTDLLGMNSAEYHNGMRLDVNCLQKKRRFPGTIIGLQEMACLGYVWQPLPLYDDRGSSAAPRLQGRLKLHRCMAADMSRDPCTGPDGATPCRLVDTAYVNREGW
jgi:hypothetical protein